MSELSQCRMRITAPRVDRVGSQVSVSADYLMETPSGESLLLHTAVFRFAWSGEFHLPGAEAVITLGLIPAMSLGLPIYSDGPIAPGTVDNLERIQALLAVTLPSLRCVPIHAPSRPLVTDPKRGVAAYFSGGVDSFQAIHQHALEITRLIYMEGFDVDLHQASHRLLVRKRMAEAADELGLPLSVVESNARHFLDRYLWWGNSYPIMLGAIAQLFVGHHAKTWVGSSTSWIALNDGRETSWLQMQFSLDDHEVAISGLHLIERPQKLASMRGFTPMLNHLRVCWDMPSGLLNCGTCDKCIRTLASLDAVGLTGQCKTLPSQVPWDLLSGLEVKSPRNIYIWQVIYDLTTDPYSRARLAPFMERIHASQTNLEFWSSGKALTEATGWPLLARKLGKPMLATVAANDRDWLQKKAMQQWPALQGLLWKKLRPHRHTILRTLFRRSARNKSAPHS